MFLVHTQLPLTWKWILLAEWITDVFCRPLKHYVSLNKSMHAN